MMALGKNLILRERPQGASRRTHEAAPTKLERFPIRLRNRRC